jgi:hypothetical protein
MAAAAAIGRMRERTRIAGNLGALSRLMMGDSDDIIVVVVVVW